MIIATTGYCYIYFQSWLSEWVLIATTVVSPKHTIEQKAVVAS